MSDRGFRLQEQAMRTLYGNNFCNFEQHRVDGAHGHYIVMIARLNINPQDMWGQCLLSIYKSRMKSQVFTFENLSGLSGYERARAVFEACVTKGVNYVVTLLHGDREEAIATAIAEFGHMFVRRQPVATPEPEIRLRSFNFDTVPSVAEGGQVAETEKEEIDVGGRWGQVVHNHNNPILDRHIFPNITVVIWMTPERYQNEAVFRYYATDDDGEYLWTFAPRLWPNKPSRQAVKSWLTELGIQYK